MIGCVLYVVVSVCVFECDCVGCCVCCIDEL